MKQIGYKSKIFCESWNLLFFRKNQESYSNVTRK